MFITNIWSIIKSLIHSFSYSLDGVFSCYQSLYLSQLCDVVWGLVRLKGNEKNGLSQQSLQSNLLPNLLNNDHFYLICQQRSDSINTTDHRGTHKYTLEPIRGWSPSCRDGSSAELFLNPTHYHFPLSSSSGILRLLAQGWRYK